MRRKNYLGKHVILDLYECKSQNLDNKEEIQQILLKTVKIGNGTIISYEFNKFEPYGVSGMVIIAESHVSIHTWPEYEYAAVDIFTCGEMKISEMENYLTEAFGSLNPLVFEHYRGVNRLLNSR